MTQDEIIRVARVVWGERAVLPFNELERFAALVAAHEREACAKVCDDGINNATDWDSSYWDQCCENRATAIRSISTKE